MIELHVRENTRKTREKPVNWAHHKFYTWIYYHYPFDGNIDVNPSHFTIHNSNLTSIYGKKQCKTKQNRAKRIKLKSKRKTSVWMCKHMQARQKKIYDWL